MIIADYHMHSDFSSDSSTAMEDMIEKGIQLGLKKMCFTDHMDYDYPEGSGYTFTFDLDQYMAKLTKMKEQYGHKIKILTGIELGLQPHLTERLNQLITSYSFDFILGSTHLLDGLDPYEDYYWANRTAEDGLRAYFQSIIDNCKAFQGFHVYGHLDYIIRYVPGQRDPMTNKITYEYRDYADLIDEGLRTILSYGKGIEVNTSGYKHGLNMPHPQYDILRRYRELGGELITIGSDAHRPEHIASYFTRAKELLTTMGFKYYATFENGKPLYEKF